MKYGLIYVLPQLSKFNLGITGVEWERLRRRWLLLFWRTVSPHYNALGTVWSWCVCPSLDIQPSFLHLTMSLYRETFPLFLNEFSIFFCLRCLLMMQLHNKIFSELSVNMNSDVNMLLTLFWPSSSVPVLVTGRELVGAGCCGAHLQWLEPRSVWLWCSVEVCTVCAQCLEFKLTLTLPQAPFYALS